MDYKFYLQNLKSLECARKIEDKLNCIEGFYDAKIDFMSKTLAMGSDMDSTQEIVQRFVGEIDDAIELIAVKLDDDNASKRKKAMFFVQAIACAILFVAAVFSDSFIVSCLLYVAAYAVVSFSIFIEVAKTIYRGSLFNELTLMILATLGAFLIKKFPEAVVIIFFYRAGVVFSEVAVQRSQKTVKTLLKMRAQTAYVIRDGEEIEVIPELVNVGDTIIVRAGERVPLDGYVIEGESELDMKALTGEAAAKLVKRGDEVLSGSINLNGLLKIRVISTHAQSTVSKILSLVENAHEKKARAEQFVRKFAKLYTPVVVCVAGVIFAIMWQSFSYSIEESIYRAIIYLMVSCPCALIVSVPLGFYGGLARAAKNAIMLKGGNSLDALSSAGIAIFDKTGTLTKGEFEIVDVVCLGAKEEEILTVVAALEKESLHPLAVAAVRFASEKVEAKQIALNDFKEQAGKGLSAWVDCEMWLCGNATLMKENAIEMPEKALSLRGSAIYVAKGTRLLGALIAVDKIKQDSAQAIKELKGLRVESIMLTGDNSIAAAQIANQIKVEKYYCELLPQEKVAKIEQIFETLPIKKSLIFVGDGINDAPCIARADVGVAMGAKGSGAAIEAADMVIMNDQPIKIAEAIKIAKKAKRIVVQNIVLCMLAKFALLSFAAFGLVNAWAAVAVDASVTYIAILNSMRAIK